MQKTHISVSTIVLYDTGISAIQGPGHRFATGIKENWHITIQLTFIDVYIYGGRIPFKTYSANFSFPTQKSATRNKQRAQFDS